jgi:hypothetical protein
VFNAGLSRAVCIVLDIDDNAAFRLSAGDSNATAGCSRRNDAASPNSQIVEWEFARTVAVWGLSSRTDISPTTAPGSAMLATTVSPSITSSRPSIRT